MRSSVGNRYQFLPEAVVVIPTQTFVGMVAGRMRRKRRIGEGVYSMRRISLDLPIVDTERNIKNKFYYFIPVKL